MNLESVKIAFEDARGWIRNVDRNVALIYTRAGSVRSNHFHRLGWHWLYVVSGRMLYFEWPQMLTLLEATVGPGDRVYTPPMARHRTEFPEDTLLISTGPTSNDDEHDTDTVAVDWPGHDEDNVGAWIIGGHDWPGDEEDEWK